jgi:FkbM family methyltransferase
MPSFVRRLALAIKDGCLFDRLRARLTRRRQDEIDPALARVLGRLRKPIIFEFGVFNGDVTRKLCGLLPTGFAAYYAWEPDPRSLQEIGKKGLPPGVHLIEAAVGAKNGSATFHLSGHASAGPSGVGSSLRTPSQENREFFPWMTFEEQVTVDVITLDSFCESRGIKGIDFIWADIQGAERDLIEGGRRVLENTKFVFLEQEGYRLYEGQWLFPELERGMGPNWKLAYRFPSDVLLYNAKLVVPSEFM